MRKLWLLTALLFVLAGCAEQPQPAVLPMPMAAPSIANVSMLFGAVWGCCRSGGGTVCILGIVVAIGAAMVVFSLFMALGRRK